MAVLAAALALGANPLPPQLPLVITGQISRVQGTDTVPVDGVAITLHRVSRTAQGPIDSAATGTDGRFRFRAACDTAAIYLVSASYAGIEYFAEPVRLPGAEGVRIIVSDTSSSAPVRLGTRHLFIRPPDESGTRAILDLFSVRNDGPDTRIGRDSLSPSWQIVLPAGALQLEVQEGDVSPSAVRFRGDSKSTSPGRVLVSFATRSKRSGFPVQMLSRLLPGWAVQLPHPEKVSSLHA